MSVRRIVRTLNGTLGLIFVLERYGRIEKILADKGYRGDLVNDLKMVYGVDL